MPNVVLLTPSGGEVSVASRKSYVQLVYGLGFRPKTGSFASNYKALAPAAAVPGADELAPVLLTDLDDPSAEAMKRLRTAFDAPFKPSTAYAKGDMVIAPDGTVVQAVGAFTSGASYNASDWSAALNTLLVPVRAPNGGHGFTVANEIIARTLGWSVITDPRFGVVTGTASSQTAAIKAALESKPGKSFYFPDGDFRLDTTLSVTSGNSIELAAGARLYAGAPMTTLVDWDNGAVSAGSYAQDKFLTGRGTIDAALKANVALAIGSVIRFTLGEGLTIIDPINRGLVTKAAGAEIIARNLRIYNTGTTNVTDNIAIEANMGDCHFSDIITRDFTVGVWDKGGNTWTKVHPWIGTTSQLTARYPTSVAFILASNSLLIEPYADTYRFNFRSAAASGYAKTRIIAPRFFCNTGNLSDALAAASPGAVFDLVDGGQMQVTDALLSGHGITPYAFVLGATTRFNARNSVDAVPGSVSGVADYRRGVKSGTSTFAANVFGSTSGGGTLSTNTCHMEVRDGRVEYSFILVGTLSAGFAGKLRIGGLPMPPGASDVKTGLGSISFTIGPDVNSCVLTSATAGPLVVSLEKMNAGATVEPDLTALANTAFQLWGRVSTAFTYPS